MPTCMLVMIHFMHISSALGVKSLGIFMDTPLTTIVDTQKYNSYSSESALKSTTHDTLVKIKFHLIKY